MPTLLVTCHPAPSPLLPTITTSRRFRAAKDAAEEVEKKKEFLAKARGRRGHRLIIPLGRHSTWWQPSLDAEDIPFTRPPLCSPFAQRRERCTMTRKPEITAGTATPSPQVGGRVPDASGALHQKSSLSLSRNPKRRLKHCSDLRLACSCTGTPFMARLDAYLHQWLLRKQIKDEYFATVRRRFCSYPLLSAFASRLPTPLKPMMVVSAGIAGLRLLRLCRSRRRRTQGHGLHTQAEVTGRLHPSATRLLRARRGSHHARPRHPRA